MSKTYRKHVVDPGDRYSKPVRRLTVLRHRRPRRPIGVSTASAAHCQEVFGIVHDGAWSIIMEIRREKYGFDFGRRNSHRMERRRARQSLHIGDEVIAGHIRRYISRYGGQ